MTDLERFVRRLVSVLGGRDPAGIHRPVSIAELRRTVLPYRLNRAAIGLSSSEDYELLVLRLIAEEGGYVRSYPPESAERARAEVSGPNPDLDLVDDLAETTIQIGAAGLARVMAAEPEAEPREPVAPHAEVSIERSAQDHPPEPEPEPEEQEVPEAPPPSIGAGLVDVPAPSVEEFEPIADSISVEDEPARDRRAVPALAPASRCPACDASLPVDRPVVFCPYCGKRVDVRLCPKCGADLAEGWKYCVRCGVEA